jgi:hypothetical protein
MEDQILQDIWDTWKPYNESTNGRWRSYIADKTMTDKPCIHLAKTDKGIVYEIES